jgi:DNA-binding PadR family transcriptional regulator
MARTFQRSPLALAILALLYEAPMHPYRMQQLIKERGKDEVINVQQRASLYQMINRLQDAGYIRVRETMRDEKRPERTLYELTDKGRETALVWTREMIATPTREFPEFPAAVSFAAIMGPDDLRQQLESRRGKLTDEITRIEKELEYGASFLPRIVLLESEYLALMLHTELAWVESVIADLRTHELTWSEDDLRRIIPPYPED